MASTFATPVHQVGAHQAQRRADEQQDQSIRHHHPSESAVEFAQYAHYPVAPSNIYHHQPTEQHQQRTQDHYYGTQHQGNLIIGEFPYSANHHHHHHHQGFEYAHQFAENNTSSSYPQQPINEYNSSQEHHLASQQGQANTVADQNHLQHQFYTSNHYNTPFATQADQQTYAGAYSNVYEQQSVAYQRHMLNAAVAVVRPGLTDQGQSVQSNEVSLARAKFSSSSSNGHGRFNHNNTNEFTYLDADDDREKDSSNDTTIPNDEYEHDSVGDSDVVGGETGPAPAVIKKNNLSNGRRSSTSRLGRTLRYKKRHHSRQIRHSSNEPEHSSQSHTTRWSNETPECNNSPDYGRHHIGGNDNSTPLTRPLLKVEGFVDNNNKANQSSSTTVLSDTLLLPTPSTCEPPTTYGNSNNISPILLSSHECDPNPHIAYSTSEPHQAINNISYAGDVNFHQLDRKLDEDAAALHETKQTSSSSQEVNNDYNQLRVLEMRKEKSRDAARSRRSKENHEFYELAKLLPLPAAITSQLDFLDKASIIRLTISFLKLRQFSVNGLPPWAPDFTTLGSINPYSSQSLSNYAEQYSSNSSSIHDEASQSRPTSVGSKSTAASKNNAYSARLSAHGEDGLPTSVPSNHLLALMPSSIAFNNSIDPVPSSNSANYRQHTATVCSANGQERASAVTVEKKSTSLFDIHQGTHILQSLDGFAFAIGRDGRFLYISETVSMYLGLSQVEMTGSSVFDYTHQQDHEELARQLGIPYKAACPPANDYLQNSSATTGLDSPQPGSVHSQYSAASNDTLIEDHINSNSPRKQPKISASTNGAARGAYGRTNNRQRIQPSGSNYSNLSARQITSKIESDMLDVNHKNCKNDTSNTSSLDRLSECVGTSDDPLVRQFCIRMKSTLTKRGCQHFKSSGYRVVHVVAHLRCYQSNDHGHLMDPYDDPASGPVLSDSSQVKQSVKRRCLKSSSSTTVKTDSTNSTTNVNSLDKCPSHLEPVSDKGSTLEQRTNSAEATEGTTTQSTMVPNQLKPKIIGMVAVAIALPPPSINELKLESDTFVLRLSLDLRVTHIEPRITELLHFPVEAIAGKSLYSIIHPADVQQVQKCHRDLLKKGQMMSGYYRILSRTGGYIWVQTCATLICNSNILATQSPAVLSASPMPSATNSSNVPVPQQYLSQSEQLQCKIPNYLGSQVSANPDHYQAVNVNKVASPGLSSHLSSSFDQPEQDQCIIFVNHMITNTVESSVILDVCQCTDQQTMNSSFSGSATPSVLTSVQANSQVTNETLNQFNSSSSSCSSPCLSSLKSTSNNHAINNHSNNTICRTYVPASTANSTGVNQLTPRRQHGAETKSKDKSSSFGGLRRTPSGKVKSHFYPLGLTPGDSDTNQNCPATFNNPNSTNLIPLTWSADAIKPLDSSHYEGSGVSGDNSSHPIYNYPPAMSGVNMALNCVSGVNGTNKLQVSDQTTWLNHHQSAAAVAARLTDSTAAASVYSANQQTSVDPYVSMDRSSLYKAAFGLEVGSSTASSFGHHQHNQPTANYGANSVSYPVSTPSTSGSSWDTTAAVAAVAAASNLTNHHHGANPYAHLDTHHHSTGLNSSAGTHHNPSSYYNYYGYYGNKFI